MQATDIPRIDPLQLARFERDYRRPRRPVVVRGLVPESELRRWSFSTIAAEFGELTVPTNVTRAGVVTADRRRGVQTEPRVLSELLEQLGANGAPSLYMMARLPELPAAWRERITTPVYCADAPWLASKVWLSPTGSVTMTHRDAADNLHLQLLGSKRFTLFAATQTAGLYPNSLFSSVPHGCKVDPEAPDLARYPRFRDVLADRAELAAGDGIYIPRGTWHHVRTMTDSLSVNFWWARGMRLPLVVGAALFKRLRGIG
jgi:cupin-like protein